MIIDVKIWVGIEETKHHEYQPTKRIPERIHSIVSNLGSLFAVLSHGLVEKKFWTKNLAYSPPWKQGNRCQALENLDRGTFVI